jgi:dTMP kinase
LPVQEISWLSSWATGGLKPDLVVLLDVDPGVGLSRVDSRGLGADRLESESRSFHERVRYAFLDLAAADPKRYLVLDAARPAEEISTAVTERLATILAAGDAAHPAPASTTVPPGPDLDAPDLAATDAAADFAATDAAADFAATDAAADFAATDLAAADAAAAAPEAVGATVAAPDAAGAAAADLSPAPASVDVGSGNGSSALRTTVDGQEPPPLEEMAEALGINDSDTPDSPTDPSQASRRG